MTDFLLLMILICVLPAAVTQSLAWLGFVLGVIVWGAVGLLILAAICFVWWQPILLYGAVFGGLSLFVLLLVWGGIKLEGWCQAKGWHVTARLAPVLMICSVLLLPVAALTLIAY